MNRRSCKRVALLLTVYCLVIAGNTQAQEYRLAFNTERMMFPGGDFQTYGFSSELFFHENWALNYNYSMGMNSRDETFFVFPGAFMTFMTLFSDEYYFYYEDFDELFLLSIIIPEGISYHAYPRDWLEVSPFFSPFTSDYNFSREGSFSPALDFGFRLYVKPDEQFFLSTGFHLKKSYSGSSPGQVVNFSVGYQW